MAFHPSCLSAKYKRCKGPPRGVVCEGDRDLLARATPISPPKAEDHRAFVCARRKRWGSTCSAARRHYAGTRLGPGLGPI